MTQLDMVLDTPWKIWNEMWRWIAYPMVRAMFAFNGLSWRSDWRLYGVPIIQRHRGSFMQFGARLQLRSSARSNPLGSNRPVILTTWQPGAVLIIGDDFGMTGGTICTAERITIGQRVAVGANSVIIDTDFHPLDPNERQKNPTNAQTAPVIIGDDVFIGMHSLVLKGVTIEQGSIIGAGSVVTRSIPARCIAAGNPARVIRSID